MGRLLGIAATAVLVSSACLGQTTTGTTAPSGLIYPNGCSTNNGVTSCPEWGGVFPVLPVPPDRSWNLLMSGLTQAECRALVAMRGETQPAVTKAECWK